MDAPLIWHIEKYLRKTGMCASSFGRDAVKDPRLVFDLRRGREPGRRIVRRVCDYMEERGPDPVTPRKPAARPVPRPVPRPALRPALRPRLSALTRPSMPRRADAGRALRIALAALLGEGARLLSSRERPWASATFTGARHYWTWALTAADGADLARWFAALLPEHEFSIRGHIVADALVTDIRSETLEDGRPATIVTLEILSVEDA